MAHNWHDGFADRQDPHAPNGSPLGSGIMVQPPTRILPEQFLLTSPSSLAQAQAQDPGAAPDDWQMLGGQPSQVSVATEPELANVGWLGVIYMETS